MASPALELAPPLDSIPSPGFKPSTEAKVYSTYPETSLLGVFEDPVRKLESAGKAVMGAVLSFPARTMDLIFGNSLWP